MNGTSIDTLFDLLGSFKKIEIPIVQRDYAQGRQNEHIKLVRDNLLADMRLAILHETPPLDLHFVYGKAENDVFIPVDGQQRLTTLFLLHLFVFHNDDDWTDLLNRFTYETRTSSRDFLAILIKNRAAVFSSAFPPSEEIEECEWFVSGWKNDPTIQSVLVMLDEIKSIFSDIADIAPRLLDNVHKPIVFKFLEIKDLGMEDSLYIKLNARGKPLTSFENFKARLIGRLDKVLPELAQEYEQCFDTSWADLFWAHGRQKLDQIYLAFFGVILMNRGIIRSDANWSNALDFNLIDKETFMTAFYTLQYISENPESQAYHMVFHALRDRPTYPQRVLFHAVTTYLHESKGIGNDSLWQWLRMIKNLTYNSQIDVDYRYRSAIDGISKLSERWDNLLDHFANNGNVTGFSLDQIKEEQTKARIIRGNKDFASAIYEAETHQYFNGQIRSALYFAISNEATPDADIFASYWSKISELFDATVPRHGHLLRQALLTFGDYTQAVDTYKTLCVNDPNEGENTPSLKRLFSNNNPTAKLLLDTIATDDDIGEQLKTIVKNTKIPENDWRYCFVCFPELFGMMSASHLRLRDIGEEWIIVPNKKSTGHNDSLYAAALKMALNEKGITSTLFSDLGTRCARYLIVNEFQVRYKNGKFVFADSEGVDVFETTTDAPITEAVKHLSQ